MERPSVSIEFVELTNNFGQVEQLALQQDHTIVLAGFVSQLALVRLE